MSSRKSRFSSWKKTFKRSSRADKQWPAEFICPISKYLMADPVIVSSGESYERTCIEAWMALGYTYCYKTRMEFGSSTLIANVALRNAISNWCEITGVQKPNPPDQDAAKTFIQDVMAKENGSSKESSLCDSREFEQRDDSSTVSSGENFPRSYSRSLENVSQQNSQTVIEKIGRSHSIDSGSNSKESISDSFQHMSLKPSVRFSHSAVDMDMRHTSLDSYSSSGDFSVPLPLATKPCSYSSQNQEIVEIEPSDPNSDPEQVMDFVCRLQQSQTLEQEQAVTDLRKLTRSSVESRTTLCNPKLLSALLPHLTSRYAGIQSNAVAALVNLSLENENKVSIVRVGAIPYLIDVLKMGNLEAQEHAAGAVFSLALNDDNKTAIGVLGAIPPLLHILRSAAERTRKDAAMALYHLSFVQVNRAKLMKAGAVSILLSLAQEEISDVACRALLILCNIASSSEGRKALLDTNATALLVGILAKHQKDRSKGSQLIQENVVAALLLLSRNNARFKSLAIQAGAMELLVWLAEHGNARTKEKVSVILSIMRGASDDEDEGSLTRYHKKLGWSALSGPNSSDF
ncbi:hypothetical protein SUGI_0735790 [Cryptomeria japonica]|uniref:U-box domain-containing protein 38 n=1 Tax=Cryptomeria japonica TaxID=3369 RepID=UPI0024149781|nr:U-box domain-containing protein 38 [Cryptomeria japonica]GLJ36599.1 hypothetical protein SUGI_0735790 [Cryptomeria japonica]